MPTNLLDKMVITKNGVSTQYYISGSVVKGYYKEADGKFYKENTYTTEIEGHNGLFYITLDTDYIYRYDEDNTKYVQIGGGGTGSAIEYVNSLPSSDIKDIIYGITTRTSHSETIADGFLDDNDLFVKTAGVGTDYTYTAAQGITLEASEDDTTYKDFISLEYNGTSAWTLTLDGSTTATLADGDTFYFKEVNQLFYAGNATEQTLIPFASGGGGGGGSTYFPGEGIDINNDIISVLPATDSTLGGVKVDDDTIKVDINGEISGNYEGGYGIKIDGNEISAKTFIGTQSEWDNLTSTQKAKFDTVSITDDSTTANNTPGHEIVDDAGIAMPQRDQLKFADATVADDSTNGVTTVTPVPYTAGRKIEIDNHEVAADETLKGTFIGTQAEWDALTTTEKEEYEIVNITDDIMTGAAVVNVVEEDNFNAVSSNAVADLLGNTDISSIGDTITQAISNTSKSIAITRVERVYLDANNSDPKVIKFSSNGHYILYSMHINASTITGMWLIYTHNSSLVPYVAPVFTAGRGVTITPAAGDTYGKITITKDQTAYIFNGGLVKLPW